MFLKKTFKRHLYHRIAIAIQEEFPALAGVTANAVMHKWGNLKNHFQENFRRQKTRRVARDIPQNGTSLKYSCS
ncbi:hypothetical protein Pmani_006620 [Petrolisthes manimaculis]|uniref:Uncharacterized protein n=1 Tax=Petrolisthes manimaculis TaxID=1843537 RepID=A0AAE1Q9Z8_9EUCA|nr:hypothetical protein Pmani_006620 [Petrolisthes manimaculis]